MEISAKKLSHAAKGNMRMRPSSPCVRRSFADAMAFLILDIFGPICFCSFPNTELGTCGSWIAGILLCGRNDQLPSDCLVRHVLNSKKVAFSLASRSPFSDEVFHHSVFKTVVAHDY